MPETDFIDEIAPEPDVKELEAETPPPVEEAPPPVDPPVEKKTDEEKLPDEEKTSVPLPALQEERTRRQDLQQQLTESNERVGKIEALFERFRAEQVPPESKSRAMRTIPKLIYWVRSKKLKHGYENWSRINNSARNGIANWMRAGCLSIAMLNRLMSLPRKTRIFMMLTNSERPL